MKYLHKLYNELQKEETLHQNLIFNYAIPESWNCYGFSQTRTIRSKELLVNPYTFYMFNLTHMLKNGANQWKEPIPFHEHAAIKGNWLKKSKIYSIMVRTFSAWDHDRDNRIDHDNLYHLSDNGTFLKSIILLPLLKRMGIDTILLHQPFALGKTCTIHDYPCKEAVTNFQEIDNLLQDPLVPQMSALEQCIAFIEACHMLGIRVILEYCPGKLARDNSYFQNHPEWFYWIACSYESTYHAPECFALPQNTLPFTFTLKDFYKSEDVKAHINEFKIAPRLKCNTLKAVEEQIEYTIAPAISDQINAHIQADKDTTIFRFYEDFHSHVPNEIKHKGIPYLTQDSIRCDLHPAHQPMTALWTMLNENIIWYQKTLGIDGIYLESPYLIPDKLQKQFVKTAHSNHKRFAFIGEDTVIENSSKWAAKGYDAISGNSGYCESDVWNFKYHSFAYQLKGNPLPMLAASEFYDSRRVSCLENGKTLANMLSIMNQFLPNGIPMFMNGIESYEVQPMQLSELGDQKYTYSLSQEDPRYRKQAYLDQFYYNYNAKDIMVFPYLMEQTNKIRKEYLTVMSDPEACIPVWFNSPRDYGIGFTYIAKDKALMVVCNTNVHNQVHLHIHTENMICQLPFIPTSILQIFSTEDPYTHDIILDEFKNIPLDFARGEVKFIEFKSLT